MAYKINIRNQGNTAWVNLLEAQYIEVGDTAGYFTGATVEAVLAEVFENKAQRVASTVDPVAANDSYQTGTVWVNTATDNVFICVDNASGAAIWLNLSSLDTEGIEDIVGAMVTGNSQTNITVTYNDATNKIDFSIAAATTTTLGVASFDSSTFTVSGGHVTITDNSITGDLLAHGIDGVSIGFDADKVDGRDVDDVTAVSTNTLWTSAKVKDYVDSLAAGISWQEPVLDKDLDDPPVAPTTGDRYIISAGLPLATGAWTGHDNSIATYNGTAWEFTPVVEGMASWVTDEDVVFVYNGATWAKIGTTITHSNLIGLQGGNGGTELYHLTSAEHTSITGSKAANLVFASPDGSAGVGGFRSLVATDIPSLLSTKISDFDEAAQDAVGAAITAGSKSNITVTYDDANNRIDFAVGTATSSTLGVASFSTDTFSVSAGHVTLVQSGIDHGSISGLGDDDHPHYVHNTLARTISAVHTFAPTAAGAPFVLGANAQGQLVTGLNADLLNGQDWTVAATASAPSSPAVNDMWVEITA